MCNLRHPLSGSPNSHPLPVRLANIQALRAFAVLLVVAVHLQFNEAQLSAKSVLSPWLYHGVSGVDLFFVTSGFIMVYISHQRFGQPSQAGLFLLDRAVRIYPPAMLFTALTILGMFVAGTTDKWFSGNNILFSFLLLPQKQDPLLGVSWTLIHELYFYLVFSVFLLGRFKHLIIWLILWGGAVAIAQVKGLWGTNPWTLIAFHPLTYEFILGALTGLVIVHFKPKHSPKWSVLALMIGAAIMVLGALNIGLPVQKTYPTGWGRVLAFAPGAALIIYGLFTLEAGGHWRAPRFMVRLGDWSYSLYLSHLLVISTIAHLWVMVALPGLASTLAFIIVSLIAVLTFSVLAYYGFERPVLRWAKATIRQFIKVG